MNRQNKIFVAAVFTLLFTMMLFAPVKRVLCAAGLTGIANIGNEITGEGITGAATAFVEDTYTNYLPYYNDFTALAGDFALSANEPFYSLYAALRRDNTPAQSDTADDTAAADNTDTAAAETTAAPAESVESYFIRSDATHRYYRLVYNDGISGERKAIERTLNFTEERLDAMMQPCLAEMTRITSYLSGEGVNVFVYSGSRFQDSPALPDCIEGEFSCESDRDEFLSALSEYATTGYLRLDTIADRFGKMFLTDHHWNAYGSDEGYRDIIAMMREVHPDMEAAREGEIITADGVDFYGSFARLANYYRLHDDFTFTDYSLPGHKVNGGAEFAATKEYYLSGKFDNTRGYDHYDAFNPFYSRVTYPDNDTGRNLLIIGDSFSRAVNEVIASHYDTTVIRQIWDGSAYDLAGIVERFGITDVLFILYSDRLMYNTYGDLNLRLIKTP